MSPITDSKTVQAQICTDTLGRETDSKFCWSAGLRCDSLQLIIPGQKNVAQLRFINSEEVYLLPLHIKLGPIKNSSRQWIKMA